MTTDVLLPTLRAPGGVHPLRADANPALIASLEALLPDYLVQQRWFGGKDQPITSVSVAEVVCIQTPPSPLYLTLLDVTHPGRTDRYVLPLALTKGAASVLKLHPQAGLAWVDTDAGCLLLYDATVSSTFWLVLLTWWQRGETRRSAGSAYRAEALRPIREVRPGKVQPLGREQSNSSALLDRRYFAKLYRRLEPGPNPEAELLAFLTRQGVPFIPSLHGTLTVTRQGTVYALAVLQEAIPVDQEGWAYVQQLAAAFFKRVVQNPLAPQTRAAMHQVAPEMLRMARNLGLRTAHLHAALAQATSPDLRPVPTTAEDIDAFATEVQHALQRLHRRLGEEQDTAAVSGWPWAKAQKRLADLRTWAPPAQRIRIHGDYHLGQLVWADEAFYILDFEGEPTRPLAERRRPAFALYDVAGLLRSMEYAVLATWQDVMGKAPALLPWGLTLVEACEEAFVDTYVEAAGDAPFLPPPASRRAFLWAHLMSKALYEVDYERNHRPGWAWLPLQGLHRLLQSPGPGA
ncbi:MAG: phosphotransferase [Bacteroidota bacterium]